VAIGLRRSSADIVIDGAAGAEASSGRLVVGCSEPIVGQFAGLLRGEMAVAADEECKVAVSLVQKPDLQPSTYEGEIIGVASIHSLRLRNGQLGFYGWARPTVVEG
jgi:hypothetical protein